MRQVKSANKKPNVNCLVLGVVFVVLLSASSIFSQAPGSSTSDPSLAVSQPAAPDTNKEPNLRIEKVPVAGGAEIMTIFAKIRQSKKEIPMVSVLRDTLGDDKPENDQLRYLWMLTYTKGALDQKLAAFVPFLYTRTSNHKNPGSGPPRPVADIRRSDKQLWNTILWIAFTKGALNPIGMAARAPVLQFRQNTDDYRRSAIAQAMSVLSLYESVNGEKVLSDTEMKDIEARLSLSDTMFGWHMQDENLSRVYDKTVASSRDIRGHNWELLRQYSENQGLFFDPLVMPDGVARHAIVWTSAEDVAANTGRKFDNRFLNIRSPWGDDRLAKWKGYSQTRWYDEENRVVKEGTPGAKPRTMIPLAIYGLDYPKIPALLVDFRDARNPKRREMTRRALHDVTSNVFALGQFSSLPYFFGRFIYDFATGRRGMDINQASRVRAYAQLKTLLALDASLDDQFRAEIADKLEKVSLNPLENDLDVEIDLALKQYENLMAYARRPDGLPAQLERERRAEMVKFVHGSKDRFFFKLAHYLTLGEYTHKEKATAELVATIDVHRQLHFHERYLREVAYASAKPEVDSDMAAIKRSLTFISQNGAGAAEKTTRALAKLFTITDDEDMRSLCVTSLYRINNAAAKKQLLAIYDNSNLPQRWRNMSAHFLKQALNEGQQMTVRDAETVAGISTN